MTSAARQQNSAKTASGAARQVELFEHAGIRWRTWSPQAVREAFSPEKTCDIVKQNRLRTVTAICPSGHGSAAYYLKHDVGCGLGRHLKKLFRVKVRSEFESGRLLQQCGVPCVDYLGWGRRGLDGYLLTAAFRHSEPVSDVWSRIRDLPERRQALLDSLIALITVSWRARLFYPDAHAGNVLAAPKGNGFRVKFVDAYGVRRVGRLTVRQKMRMTGIFLFLYHDLGTAEVTDLFDRLAEHFEDNAVELRKRFQRTFGRRNRTLSRKRRHKFLKNSSIVATVHSPDAVWRMSRNCPSWFDRAFAERAVAAHRRHVKAGEGLLKTDRKRRLSRYTEAEQSVVVKEFVNPRPAGLLPADRRSWMAACALELYPIPACRYWAWMRTGMGAFMLMEDVGRNDLRTELFESPHADGRPKKLLTKVGRIVGDMHSLGIFHRDLKVTNFVLSENADADAGAVPDLKLVDLDAVAFHRNLSRRCRIRNLVQLHQSLPPESRTRHWPVLCAAYGRAAGLNEPDLRRLMKDVEGKVE